jgi:hypothetical protein
MLEGLLSVVDAVAAAFATARLAGRNERAKLREELKLEYSVETAIRHLLENPAYQKRSLRKIKHHIRGFPDDDLRRALVRAGAVAFGGSGDEEKWGLLNRNREDVK